MSKIVTRFKWAFAIGLVAVLALSLAVGCSDDDDNGGNGGDETPIADETPQATDDGGGASAADIAELETVFKETAESDATNADFLFAHVTDNFIETVFFSNREDCMAGFDDCIGEPTPVESITDTAIDGDTASLIATLADFGTFEFGLIREDGVWLVDSMQATSDEVSGDVPLVDLTLGEFAFGFDETAIPADGNFAFHVNNAGGQVHEVVVVPISSEGDLETALQALEESGAEPDPAGLKVYIQPGQEIDMAFEGPLASGRYAMVCFFPDISSPEFTPHAELGMVNEFTIQ